MQQQPQSLEANEAARIAQAACRCALEGNIQDLEQKNLEVSRAVDRSPRPTSSTRPCSHEIESNEKEVCGRLKTRDTGSDGAGRSASQKEAQVIQQRLQQEKALVVIREKKAARRLK